LKSRGIRFDDDRAYPNANGRDYRCGVRDRTEVYIRACGDHISRSIRSHSQTKKRDDCTVAPLILHVPGELRSAARHRIQEFLVGLGAADTIEQEFQRFGRRHVRQEVAQQIHAIELGCIQQELFLTRT
jgi:hypothetical protein